MLRFGVLAHAESVCTAHAQSLQHVVRQGIGECVGVITGAPGLPAIPFGGGQARQVQPVALRELFPRAPRFSIGEQDAIRALNLDFIFNASFLCPAGEVVEAARHGLLTILYDPDPQFGCWPPAFSGVIRKRSCSSVVLHRADSGSNGFVLTRATINTIRDSYRANLEQALAAGIDLPVHAARKLLAGRELQRERAPWSTSGVAPSSARMLHARARIMFSWVRAQTAGAVLSEDWRVGIVNAPIESFLDSGFRPDVEWLAGPPRGRFWADPFPAPGSGGQTLLVEEFDNARYQGYISAVSTGGTRVLIDENVHMSYPFPLEHAGEFYLLPESHRTREVTLFRLDADGEWRRAARLLSDFAALDSTVLQHEGRWWLFCTCQDDLPECKLYIFHAPDLLGPWEPHALNPVKCDVRSSRPGGTPFRHDGELYRPAQDASKSYGSALSINRIKILTPDEFEEELVAHWPPLAPCRDGLHTLSAAGPRTLVDGKRMVFAPRLMVRRLKHKIVKLMAGGNR